jgi:Mce-associated membrane protein
MPVTSTPSTQLDSTTTDPPDSDAHPSKDADPAEANDSVGGDASSTGTEPGGNDKPPARRRLSISVSARGLVIGALIAILVGALATVSWLYIGARRDLDTQARKSANDAHAEKIALDYAVNAATMDVKDLNSWKTKLVAGTSQELNDSLTKASTSMEQILVPLQWSSTAQPLAAKVHSETGGVYLVDCFVSVQTKTVQAPDALQSTATYSLTIDSNKNWQITDVGGIGQVVGQR